jgi:hypothetical protein
LELTPNQVEFIESNRSAAMITIGDDGMPKAVRVGVVLVDGRLWSSGTADRVRTRRLREDPRCTLFVFGKGYHALTLETRVEILDGPDVVGQSVHMFRTTQDRPEGPLMWFGYELDEPEFRQTLIDQGRLIYEFHPTRAYGVE